MPEWRVSKCLPRFFHYVIIQYILFPVLKKYISFALARYALGNCFSSIILTTQVLTAPDSLGKAPAVPTNTFFPWDFPVCHPSCPAQREPLIWDVFYLCQWRFGVRTWFTMLILNICKELFHCLSSAERCSGGSRAERDLHGWNCIAHSCTKLTFMAKFYEKNRILKRALSKVNCRGTLLSTA